MKPEFEDNYDPTKPAAYDPQGRPLYYHPPEVMLDNPPQPSFQSPSIGSQSSHVNTRPESIEGENFNPRIRSQYANEPKIVHAGREIEPKKMNISPELAAKHEASVRRYPFLNLSEGEFVILDIKRHPIGMLIPIGITGVLLLAIFSFAAIYPSLVETGMSTILPDPIAVVGVALLLAMIVALGGAAALWVYLQNQFFMTNEAVIQEVQESLFSRHEQTVSLGSIEDASFRQSGIVQLMFNYGTIRLSTEGEETTYVFRYVSSPKTQITRLTNAIEAFKNGRPVTDD